MGILASFNYTGPSGSTIAVALLVAATVLLLLGATRNVIAGVCGGALSGAALAWVVLGAGGGDLTGLMQLVCSPVCGVLGCRCRRSRWRNRESPPEQVLRWSDRTET
jgi:hypothetical protein